MAEDLNPKIEWMNTGVLGLLVLVLGLVLHLNHMDEYPLGHHTWSQTDHYALSLRFQENGFDFFHPQTYTINRNRTGDVETPTGHTITAVDPPVHQYLVAALMAVIGSDEAWVFRWYVFVFGLIGLLFLGKLVRLLTGRWDAAYATVIFASTMPVFTYFHSAMMPSVPSWSLAVVGIFLWVRHHRTAALSPFFGAVFFLTLATLSRMTFAIPFLAIAGWELLAALRGVRVRPEKWIAFAVALVLVGGSIAYNGYLRNTYGSTFLFTLMPPGSFAEAFDLLRRVLFDWGLHYFTWAHYVIILLALGFMIWLQRLRDIPQWHAPAYFRQMLLIYTIGCVLFAGLMLQQFRDHDYYFLDTFFTPVVLLFGLLVGRVFSASPRPKLNYLFIGFFLSFLVTLAAQRIDALHHADWWQRNRATYHNFAGSKQWISKHGVTEDDVILVLDAYAPNLPFIHLRQEGHAIVNTSARYITQAMEWHWDYALIQNAFFFSDIYKNYPEILRELEFIETNGKLSLYRRNDTGEATPLRSFIGLNRETPVFTSALSLDTLQENWRFSGEVDAFGVLETRAEYPITFRLPGSTLPVQKDVRILSFLSVTSSENTTCELVLSILRNDSALEYRSFKQYYQKQAAVSPTAFLIQLNRIPSDAELRVYLWNPERAPLGISSGSVEVFE